MWLTFSNSRRVIQSAYHSDHLPFTYQPFYLLKVVYPYFIFLYSRNDVELKMFQLGLVNYHSNQNTEDTIHF